MIEVTNISKAFGPVQAVISASFQAADGQITGLLGPNGAGKSTTMRMITAVLEPDTGAAFVDGYNTATETLSAQRHLGVLPDTRGLYPRLTSRENIRYFARLRGLQGVELEQRITHLLDLLDMADIADRPTDGFSTGQQVKVAIARALVHNPRNVMLDEPTNGLDVMSTRAMRSFIRRLRDEGRCVLLSSHIMQEVAALCDKVVIIAGGRIVAQGTPEQLREETGEQDLEEVFVQIIGTKQGLQ